MRSLAVLLSCCVALPALAEDVPPALTISKCMDINAAMGALDKGWERVVKEGERERVVAVPYKVGDARMPMALNMSVLRPYMDGAEKQRQEIIADVIDQMRKATPAGQPEPTDIKPGTREFEQYLKRYQKVLEQPCNVTLAHIKTSSLALSDDNPIPATVISVLKPLLD